VDISWLGHACVRLRTRTAAVVMDPASKDAGFDMGRPTANIVTISRHHPHHAHAAGVRGQPVIIDGPGEYEIEGVQLFGLPSPIPPQNGGSPERNTAYLVEAEGLLVAHLGGGCAPPSASEAELLSNVDILIVPIDGDEAIEPTQAARTVRDLEPTIVIPVSYPGPSAKGKDSALQAFLDATGLSAGEPEQKLSVRSRQLGENQRIVLLEASRS
jgi:L-ascorbate metabolism protein UlaG (beta-lactamase superfamily)